MSLVVENHGPSAAAMWNLMGTLQSTLVSTAASSSAIFRVRKTDQVRYLNMQQLPCEGQFMSVCPQPACLTMSLVVEKHGPSAAAMWKSMGTLQYTLLSVAASSSAIFWVR